MNKCWTPQMLDPAYTFNPKTGKVIFSFPSEKYLYIYDYKTDSVDEIEVGYTQYFKEIEPFIDCEEVPKKIVDYFLNTPSYLTIVYDTYRDIYYRLFFLPPKEVHAGMRSSHTHKRIGLTIYNNNFEKLYETLFDPYEFSPTDYFMTKEGLWLSKNNPENPDFDENFFQFALLNLKENE